MVIYVYNYVYSKKKCYDIIDTILAQSESVAESYINTHVLNRCMGIFLHILFIKTCLKYILYLVFTSAII